MEIKMSIDESINKMKNIQRALLEFIEEESNVEENYLNFINILEDEKILEDHSELIELLLLINNIVSNHCRIANFFYKIEQIFQHLKNKILQYFSNIEIFNFFKENKRILLLLIEQEIIIIDDFFVLSILNKTKYKYPNYFAPEIAPFITKEFIEKNCNNDDSILKDDDFIKEIKIKHQKEFFEKRKKGENENYLSEIIRLNQVKNFIDHVNKNNLSLDSNVQESIFETNQLLLKNNKSMKIIEYAAFFGSIEIIKYMQNNGAELTPNIWLYAVHSRNVELIKYLIDNKIQPPENSYEKTLKESIKCFHSDVSDYLIINFFNEEELKYNIENRYDENIHRYGFKYRNYYYFPKNAKNKFVFCYSCEFNYYKLVKLFLENMSVDINEPVILKNSIF